MIEEAKFSTTFSNIQLRRGTSSRWAANNPILRAGEVGYDTTVKKIKIGDGITSWNNLPFFATEQAAMPTASIIQTARVTAPTGWLLCQGQSLPVADYAELHSAIGYTYGGSGLNFSLPDLRGKVPVGKNSGTFATLGATGGVESTALTSSHIPQHSHPIDHDHASFTTASGGGHTHTFGADDMIGSQGSYTRTGTFAYDATSTSSGSGGDFTTKGTGNHTHTVDVPAFTGSSGNYGSATVTPVSALQPYVVLNYMIKT